jgi:hypothetical protein
MLPNLYLFQGDEARKSDEAIELNLQARKGEFMCGR